MATTTVIKVIDDLTGKEISEDDRIVWEVEFNGVTYKVDTTEANRDKAVDRITELLDPNSPKRLLPTTTSSVSSSSAKVSKEHKQKVIAAYNKANPGQDASRYGKTVKEWEASHYNK